MTPRVPPGVAPPTPSAKRCSTGHPALRATRKRPASSPAWTLPGPRPASTCTASRPRTTPGWRCRRVPFHAGGGGLARAR
eukprot:4797821-Alexandrium_andersonii.AAC.2